MWMSFWILERLSTAARSINSYSSNLEFPPRRLFQAETSNSPPKRPLTTRSTRRMMKTLQMPTCDSFSSPTTFPTAIFRPHNNFLTTLFILSFTLELFTTIFIIVHLFSHFHTPNSVIILSKTHYSLTR